MAGLQEMGFYKSFFLFEVDFSEKWKFLARCVIFARLNV